MLPLRAATKYTALSWILFVALIFLFGAPFFSDTLETVVLAACLSLTSVVLLAASVDTEERLFELIALGSESDPTPREALALHSSVFSLLGAWACAAVYPLDWDRWWQRFPLPSLFGCFGGAFIGLLVGIVRVWINNSSLKKAKRR